MFLRNFLGGFLIAFSAWAEPVSDEIDQKLGLKETAEEKDPLSVPKGLEFDAGDPSLPDKGPYTIELVTWDDPRRPVDASTEYREFQRALTVTWWIPDIRLNGLLVTPPESQLLDDLGLVVSMPPRRKTDLEDGLYRFQPGDASFEVHEEVIRSRSKAVMVEGNKIRLRLVPVTFEFSDKDRTRRLPFSISIWADGCNLLQHFEKLKPTLLKIPKTNLESPSHTFQGPALWKKSFHRLTLFLPVGQDYVCSWAEFSVTPEGEVKTKKALKKLHLEGRTFRLVQSDSDLPAPARTKDSWFRTMCGKVPVLGPRIWKSGAEAILGVGGETDIPLPQGRLEFAGAFAESPKPPVELVFSPATPPVEMARSLGEEGRAITAFMTRADIPWTGLAQFTFRLGKTSFSEQVIVVRPDPVHLFIRRGRSAFFDHETIECRAVVLAERPGQLELTLQETGRPEILLGSAALEAHQDPQTVFFSLKAQGLRPGDYRLLARFDQRQSPPASLSIRSSARKSNLLASNITICLEGWDNGPGGEGGGLPDAAGRQASIGFEMLTRSGFTGILHPTMGAVNPSLAAALAEEKLPVAYGFVPTRGGKFLDECVRHRIGTIDYISTYGWPWSFEGLAFHHSYTPDVNRWYRREQLVFGAAADFPSLWGVNYTWFPALFGYYEGSGVYIDPHVEDRNRILYNKLDQRGLNSLSSEESDSIWQNAFSNDGEKRARAESLVRRHVDRVRGYGEAFHEHFSHYRDGIREIRPEGKAFAFGNAGHDNATAGNYLPLFYGGLDAATMEAYTDHGDWALEPAFTTDWVRGAMKACPDRHRPFWLAAEWSAPPPIRFGYMLQAIARRVEGASYPFPASWPKAMERTVGNILSFLKAYGGVQPFVEVEPDLAILCSFSQMAFDSFALFRYHACYYELTRAQFPPQCIYEETIERGGLRNSGVKLLILVRQTVPLPSKVLEEIQAFQKAGGVVIMDAASTLPLAGAHRLTYAFRHIWEEGMGGFPQEHRLALWKEYLKHRDELKNTLQGHVRPFAQSEDERIITSTLVGGDVRFVFAINDGFDPDRPEQQFHLFYRKRDVPIRLRDPNVAVYDLQTLERIPGDSSEEGLLLRLNLFDHPGLILAILPEELAGITTDAPDEAELGAAFSARARLIGRSGRPVGGPTPVRYVLRTPQGELRETLFRAAGVEDPALFRLGLNDEPGEWKLEVTDFVSGKQLRAAVRAQPLKEFPRLAVPMGRVLLPQEAATRDFLHSGQEKLIFLEENQLHLKPLAERLAAALEASGQAARIVTLDSTCFAEIPLRWYPTKHEEELYRQIDAGRLIGVRVPMRPYIEPERRRHVTALGGYEDLLPEFIVRHPNIVFSGGGLASSLAPVIPYPASPDDPGPGNAVLAIAFSAFEARCHTLAIVASDLPGFEAAIEKTIALLSSHSSPSSPDSRPPSPQHPSPLPFALSPASPSYTGEDAPLPLAPGSSLLNDPPSAVTRAWRPFSGETISFRHPVADQFKAFFTSIVAVNRHGDFLVQPEAGQRRILLSREGKVLGMLEAPKGTFCARLADDARSIYFGLWGDERIEWTRTLIKKPLAVQCAPDGLIHSVSLLWPEPGNDYAPWWYVLDRTDYFIVGRDGRSLYRAREGGITAGPPGGPYRLYDHAPHFRDIRETHSPDWPMAMALSADGRTLVMSCWGHPMATSMNAPIMSAVSPEVVALDVATLQTRWKRTGNGWSHAPPKNCLCVNADASRVGYVDGSSHLYVLDASGEVVWEKKLPPVPWGNGTEPVAPDRVQMSEDGERILVTYREQDLLVLARKATESISFFPAPADSALAPDGRFVLVTATGEVQGFSRDAEPSWTKKPLSGRPALAPLDEQGLALAFGDGSVECWNWNGEPVWKITAQDLPAGPSATLRPATDLHRISDLPGLETGTLDILKKYCRARLAAKLDPSKSGILPASSKLYNIHLLYRKPEGNPLMSILLTDGKRREEFQLDLSAPHWRTQDIAWPGQNLPLSLQLKATPSIEIAEFEAWEFEWPSRNLAFIRQAREKTEAESLSLGKDEGHDGEEFQVGEIDMEEDPASQGLHGVMKEARIRVENPDPDQVTGHFLPPGDDPLKVLNEILYSGDGLRSWYLASKGVGAGGRLYNPRSVWFEVDFGKSAKFDLVAYYAPTNRQSELLRCIGLLAHDELDPEADPRFVALRPLALATENDQFFRVFEIPRARGRVLRCYLGEIRQSYGASEIEVYSKVGEPVQMAPLDRSGR